MGLPYVPSYANFVLVDFSGANLPAGEINKQLLSRGIIVRPVAPYGLAQHLRVTVGLPEENDILISALEEILKK